MKLLALIFGGIAVLLFSGCQKPIQGHLTVLADPESYSHRNDIHTIKAILMSDAVWRRIALHSAARPIISLDPVKWRHDHVSITALPRWGVRGSRALVFLVEFRNTDLASSTLILPEIGRAYEEYKLDEELRAEKSSQAWLEAQIGEQASKIQSAPPSSDEREALQLSLRALQQRLDGQRDRDLRLPRNVFFDSAKIL